MLGNGQFLLDYPPSDISPVPCPARLGLELGVGLIGNLKPSCLNPVYMTFLTINIRLLNTIDRTQLADTKTRKTIYRRNLLIER